MTLLLILSMPAQKALAENLESAWLEALANDHIIQARQSYVLAAEEDLSAAQASRLPTVLASAGVTLFDSTPAFDFSAAGIPGVLPLFGDDSMEMANAQVTLPLYTGGTITHGIDAAQAMLNSQKFQSGVSSQQLKLAVAQHYINVLRANSALFVADTNVKSLSAHLRDVEDMWNSGAVAKSDYLAAAVSLANSEQLRLQAGNSLDLAKAAYNRALGRNLGAPVDLDENLPGIDPQLDIGSLEALSSAALQYRDEISGLGAAAEAYQLQAESVRGKSKPQLAVTGGYMYLDNEFLNSNDYWMVGIGLQWNLFDGGQIRKKANALSFKSDAARLEQNNLRSLIQLQVRQSWLRLNETRERIRLTERAVEQAEENLRVVRDRYRNGEGTNTEVLNAQVLRSLSRSNYDNADLDAKLALYELARGVGRL